MAAVTLELRDVDTDAVVKRFTLDAQSDPVVVSRASASRGHVVALDNGHLANEVVSGLASGGHASLTWVDGEVYVKDLDSTHGTLHYGAGFRYELVDRQSPRALSTGDVVVFGRAVDQVEPVTLRVHLEPVDAPAAAPRPLPARHFHGIPLVTSSEHAPARDVELAVEQTVTLVAPPPAPAPYGVQDATDDVESTSEASSAADGQMRLSDLLADELETDDDAVHMTVDVPDLVPSRQSSDAEESSSDDEADAAPVVSRYDSPLVFPPRKTPSVVSELTSRAASPVIARDSPLRHLEPRAPPVLPSSDDVAPTESEADDDVAIAPPAPYETLGDVAAPTRKRSRDDDAPPPTKRLRRAVELTAAASVGAVVGAAATVYGLYQYAGDL